MPVSPIEFVALVLAAARVTRLAVEDTITEPVRESITRASQATGPRARFFAWLDEMLSCHWCAGLWVSAAVVALWWVWGDSGWLRLPVAIAAVAQVQAMVNEREERSDG